MSIIQEALKKAGFDTEKIRPIKTDMVRPEKNVVAGKPFASKVSIQLSKKNKIISGLIAISFILFFTFVSIDQFLTRINSKQAPQLDNPIPSFSQNIQYKMIEKRSLPNFEAITNFGKNFTSDRLATGGHPKLVLNGIMYVESNPKAIINNTLVELDDYIDGAKVVAITDQSVVLEYNTTEITLKLK